jgi:formylglycine-generating enzyme required for sulfatase activity
MRFISSILLLAAPALAQPGPGPDPSGIDFVTIGAVGNRGYDGPDPNGFMTGRGRVDYEYKIGRFEVTSAQWAEFFRAVDALPQPIPYLGHPSEVGAGPMGAVGGITWRTAAFYCNWLHNDKGTSRDAFLSGAYDASTFGYDADGVFTDQATHSPGARYWIPSLDEWLKAAHYDPNRPNGDGSMGGWWQYSITRDTAPTYGRPPSWGGTGEANAGFILANDAQFNIPLGAYSTITSPWGLFDTAGGTAEWTESIYHSVRPRLDFRIIKGSAWTGITGGGAVDAAWEFTTETPGFAYYEYGLRLASAVPAPATGLTALFALTLSARRRRHA